MAFLYDLRFHVFVVEMSVGLIIIWLAALLLTLLLRSRWERNSDYIVEKGAYNCWMAGFIIHLLITLGVNATLIVRGHVYQEETISDYWPFLLFFTLTLFFDAFMLLSLSRRKHELSEL